MSNAVQRAQATSLDLPIAWTCGRSRAPCAPKLTGPHPVGPGWESGIQGLPLACPSPGPSNRIVTARKELGPAQCDFSVGLLLDSVGSIAEHEMQVVAHNGITAHRSAEQPGEGA